MKLSLSHHCPKCPLHSLFVFPFSSTVFIFMLALVGVFYPHNRGALFIPLVVMHSCLGLQDTHLLLSIVSLKERPGLV